MPSGEHNGYRRDAEDKIQVELKRNLEKKNCVGDHQGDFSFFQCKAQLLHWIIIRLLHGPAQRQLAN